MVDLTITEANVDWVSGSRGTSFAAETITAGDLLYDTGSSTVGVADVTTATKDVVVGIALNAGTAGHTISYATTGAVVGFGAILTVGVWYCLSASGAIAPVADLATSDYISFVGYGITTSNMQVQIFNTGLQFA